MKTKFVENMKSFLEDEGRDAFDSKMEEWMLALEELVEAGLLTAASVLDTVKDTFIEFADQASSGGKRIR